MLKIKLFTQRLCVNISIDYIKDMRVHFPSLGANSNALKMFQAYSYENINLFEGITVFLYFLNVNV